MKKLTEVRSMLHSSWFQPTSSLGDVVPASDEVWSQLEVFPAWGVVPSWGVVPAWGVVPSWGVVPAWGVVSSWGGSDLEIGQYSKNWPVSTVVPNFGWNTKIRQCCEIKYFEITYWESWIFLVNKNYTILNFLVLILKNIV